MKLSLRDLFWLMLVVALGLGWWLDRVQLRRKASNALLQASKMESMVAEMQSRLKDANSD